MRAISKSMCPENACGVGRADLRPRRARGDDPLRLGVAQRRGVGGQVPVVRGPGTRRDERPPALLERAHQVAVPADAHARALLEQRDVRAPAGAVDVQERVGAERRARSGRPSRGPPARRGPRASRSRHRWSPGSRCRTRRRAPAGRKRRLLQALGQQVVQAVGGVGGRTLVEPEHLDQHVLEPVARGRPAEQRPVGGERAPDLARVRRRLPVGPGAGRRGRRAARPGTPACAPGSGRA